MIQQTTATEFSVDSILDLDPAWFVGDGTLRASLAPEDVRHDNTRRAGRAARAVLSFAADERWYEDERPSVPIQVLLGDLMHLCDSLGIDYDEIHGYAEAAYSQEISGE